jgi:hypothetical protein
MLRVFLPFFVPSPAIRLVSFVFFDSLTKLPFLSIQNSMRSIGFALDIFHGKFFGFILFTIFVTFVFVFRCFDFESSLVEFWKGDGEGGECRAMGNYRSFRGFEGEFEGNA